PIIIIIILISSFVIFSFTEFLDPFQRVIQPEEIWLYKNPLVQSDNIPTRLMFAISFLTPLAVIFVVKIIRRTDKTEIKEAFLGNKDPITHIFMIYNILRQRFYGGRMDAAEVQHLGLQSNGKIAHVAVMVKSSITATALEI
ncbi:hypothetical protein ASZ78_000137, partial [Callipepla squamata]